MSMLIELYTAEAVATGFRRGADAAVQLRDTLESAERVRLVQPQWTPLHREPSSSDIADEVPVDDVIVAVGEYDPRRTVHANWHQVALDAGPYRITGLLAVLPGFDPNRALTRPGGTFIPLNGATLEIIDMPDAGRLARDQVLVNRYCVDRVSSTLQLSFFFPAAKVEVVEGTSVA